MGRIMKSINKVLISILLVAMLYNISISKSNSRVIEKDNNVYNVVTFRKNERGDCVKSTGMTDKSKIFSRRMKNENVIKFLEYYGDSIEKDTIKNSKSLVKNPVKINQYAVDETGTLSSNQLKSLISILKEFDIQTTNQVVVYVIQSLNGELIADVAFSLANYNRIGQKDKNNGVLFLIAMKEKKLRIEVGLGLEKILTNDKCAQIIREDIVPDFKKSNFYEGITKGINAIISVLENKSLLMGDEYSGVYEGEIDFSMCCEMFEKGNGNICFDFSKTPPQILYDGILIENFSMESNVLKDKEEFSYYPNNIIGTFENFNGNNGFWYNFQSGEETGMPEKSFLRKTGDVSKAKELIKLAEEEKRRFEEFWYKFKKAIQEKDFKALSNYANYPVIDESELISKYKLNKSINNTDELINRFKLIFTSEFYTYENKWNVFRYEDHFPLYGGKYMFMPNVFIIIEKFDVEFKITQIVGPWG